MNTDDISQKSLDLHEKFRGKIETKLRDSSIDKAKLSSYYTPGVAAISRHLAEHPEDLGKYTWVNNLVAVISDGSAVLGLGNIGPKASLPVMEGKSLLFKHFANIDSIPIILDVHDVNSVVETIKAIAPSFGAINLEDFAAPQCFAIEERLKSELDIPVMHDDQHGTAIVVLAGLINSMKVINKTLNNCKITLVGAGAAGTAITKLLKLYAPDVNIIVVDSKGIISRSRQDLNPEKQMLLSFTNSQNISGSLADAINNSDIFIGVSSRDLLTPELVETMSSDPIVFALANPDPEISPELAKETRIKILATGRSDYPNQVNNALAFPGTFRGALDNHVTKITDQHKLDAAKVIASLVGTPSPENIIPSVFDERLVPSIAKIIT